MWKYIVILAFGVLVAASAKEGMVDDCPAKINFERAPAGAPPGYSQLREVIDIFLEFPNTIISILNGSQMKFDDTTPPEFLINYILNNIKLFYITVPVSVCEHRCTSGFVPYPRYDFTSRFVMWIAPVFMLLGNIHIPPLGQWNTYCVIVHALGDPMDFMASLITRLEVGSRLYKLWKEREVYLQPGSVSYSV